jgi:cytochrome b subunit of formate dehydrogenase
MADEKPINQNGSQEKEEEKAKTHRWKIEALARFRKEMEDEILGEFEKELDEEVAGEIWKKIKGRVIQEIQEEIAFRQKHLIQKVKWQMKAKLAQEKWRRQKKEDRADMVLRLGRNFRFQHVILFTSCVILILTGLPLKFAHWGFSENLIDFFGGIEWSTKLHRLGAAGLMFVAIYHTIYTIFSKMGRSDFIKLLPMPKDFLNFFQQIKYYLGINADKPKFDRFSYIEKFDYWAVYWGCVIMIGSGLMLWFENTVLQYFPKWLLDISKEAHSDEALLATLAIIIWHFYNVHLNADRFPGSMMWWHGKIKKEELREEHPLEYERLFGKEETEDG